MQYRSILEWLAVRQWPVSTVRWLWHFEIPVLRFGHPMKGRVSRWKVIENGARVLCATCGESKPNDISHSMHLISCSTSKPNDSNQISHKTIPIRSAFSESLFCFEYKAFRPLQCSLFVKGKFTAPLAMWKHRRNQLRYSNAHKSNGTHTHTLTHMTIICFTRIWLAFIAFVVEPRHSPSAAKTDVFRLTDRFNRVRSRNRRFSVFFFLSNPLSASTYDGCVPVCVSVCVTACVCASNGRVCVSQCDCRHSNERIYEKKKRLLMKWIMFDRFIDRIRGRCDGLVSKVLIGALALPTIEEIDQFEWVDSLTKTDEFNWNAIQVAHSAVSFDAIVDKFRLCQRDQSVYQNRKLQNISLVFVFKWKYSLACRYVCFSFWQTKEKQSKYWGLFCWRFQHFAWNCCSRGFLMTISVVLSTIF